MATNKTSNSNAETQTKSSYPYLRFDAFSMKDLINKKLSEDSSITDHLYEGSNISIFVDIISTMFESLMFNLNQNAAECNPSTSLIYKNISRLVKFLGYSPNGYKSSTVNVVATSKSKKQSFLVVPKYSTITLEENDDLGNNIAFSTTDFFYINANTKNDIKLVNGFWKKYPTTFVATGEPYEKFILNALKVDDVDNPEVAYPYIDVYVKRNIGDEQYETLSYSAVTDGMYIDTTENSILKPTDRKFALRLNENKMYEIEFGDGVHGETLSEGDIVNIVYLQSNGYKGEINANDIDNQMFTVGINGITEDDGNSMSKNLSMVNILELSDSYTNSIYTYNKIGKYLGDSDGAYGDGYSDDFFYYGCTNVEKSSTPSPIESVEQIRNNAPNYFKRAGRISTSEDFTNVIKERFYSDIIDCYTMNNVEYSNTFNKWLWRVGYEKCRNPRKWLNPSLMSYGTYGYKYSDAADSNNVYIWLKQETDNDSIGNYIIEELKDECPLTANIVALQAVDEKFALCAGLTETYNSDGTLMSMRDFYNGSTDEGYFYFSDKGQNRLEVTLRSDMNISESIVKNRIVEAFKNFFSTKIMNIGDTVSIGDLENSILNINGVSRVSTIFRKLLSDGTYSTTDMIRRSGICLAHWNDTIVRGYDIDVSNGNVTLEKFQFPMFLDYKGLLNQIDIISDGSVNIV